MRGYEAKMQILYEGAARECKADFVKELLQQRAVVYRDKCRARETADEGSARFFAYTSREGKDQEPLLGSGLRKRAITVPDTHSMES